MRLYVRVYVLRASNFYFSLCYDLLNDVSGQALVRRILVLTRKEVEISAQGLPLFTILTYPVRG
jgi:hypothetical protein